MDHLIELKKIWRAADTLQLPDAATVALAAKKYRSTHLRKKIWLIGMATLLGGLMLWVIYNYHSTLVSTRIGEGLTLLSTVIFIFTNTRSLNRLNRVNDVDNKVFIAYLEQVYKNRRYFYHVTQPICFALSTAGILLYFFELLQNTPYLIPGYCLIMIYLLFMWLYVRPRTFKKQSEKLELTRRHISALSEQL
ncbi:hypothetical protein [Mucilaginibacter sp. UYCu711]|uniref:hypothetical protein n=1 Tax=Mucilaginibacter sp. UYCu711 TaxID=3156339 RepID=UPI003D1CC8F8